VGWYTRRVLTCVAVGVALTLASAWLPGAVIPMGQTRHVWGSGSYSRGYSVYGPPTTKMSRAWAPGVSITYLQVGYTPDGQPGAVPTGTEPELEGVWTPWMRTTGLRVLRGYVAAGDLPFDTICFETRGWPMPAAWCEYRYPPPPTGATLEPRGAIALPGDHPVGLLPIGTVPRALPCRPIWSGLLIDASFWTAAAAPLVFAPSLVRGIRRRRANGCSRCGYDLTGLAGSACPECGTGQKVTAAAVSPAAGRP
jgi:hypothetical protein